MRTYALGLYLVSHLGILPLCHLQSCIRTSSVTKCCAFFELILSLSAVCLVRDKAGERDKMKSLANSIIAACAA